MGQQVDRIRGKLKGDGQVILEDVEFIVVTSNGMKRWHATLTPPELGNFEMTTYLLKLADGTVGRNDAKTRRLTTQPRLPVSGASRLV